MDANLDVELVREIEMVVRTPMRSHVSTTSLQRNNNQFNLAVNKCYVYATDMYK